MNVQILGSELSLQYLKVGSAMGCGPRQQAPEGLRGTGPDGLISQRGLPRPGSEKDDGDSALLSFEISGLVIGNS